MAYAASGRWVGGSQCSTSGRFLSSATVSNIFIGNSLEENHPFPEGQDHLLQEKMRFLEHLWYAYVHFMPYLLGHPFTVVTHHKALIFLVLKDPHSHQLAHWMDTLRQFTFSISVTQEKIIPTQMLSPTKPGQHMQKNNRWIRTSQRRG